MRRVVVGTAGHIDHGKTRLVAALTGIDCDRLAEEKARGITIDLGFAHLSDGDLQLGFVDVPGHERFVHNALAGLGGIRLMVLVVAADEGVKPQTREHLDICSLLQIPAGVVVLTKADLVAEDLLELARMELEELLEDGPFARAPILTVSSDTGQGIPELRRALLDAASKVDSNALREEAPTRLPVDRAFHLRGLGAIATGTLVTGRVKPGDTLSLLPTARPVRVRSVQVHGEERAEAVAGERTSLQLTGLSLHQLERGMQLVTPDAFSAATELCARFRLLPDAPAPVRGFAPLRFHLYSSEVVGKIRALDPPQIKPGDEGLVEIRVNAPVVAVRGDRFIVRRPSPQTTLGGGEVLDPDWHRHRGKMLRRGVEALGKDTPEALLFWVLVAGEGGTTAAELARRVTLPVEEVEALLADLASEDGGEAAQVREVPADSSRRRRWVAASAYERVRERARSFLAEYFRRDRLARGVPKAEAVRRILPGRAAELTATYLSWLVAEEVLVLEGDLINLPGRGNELTGEESSLARSIVAGFDRQGLTPSSPNELCRSLGAKPQIFDGVLRFLLERNKLVRLPSGLILSHSAVAKLQEELAATQWRDFSVGEFKDHFGLTRKWAIPLLEYLDSIGATRRVGDRRQWVRR